MNDDILNVIILLSIIIGGIFGFVVGINFEKKQEVIDYECREWQNETVKIKEPIHYGERSGGMIEITCPLGFKMEMEETVGIPRYEYWCERDEIKQVCAINCTKDMSKCIFYDGRIGTDCKDKYYDCLDGCIAICPERCIEKRWDKICLELCESEKDKLICEEYK